jgi:type I restriction-modification system DNA methylase subunit
MTSIQQRAALQSQIWKIANDVRGSVDGWDFKQYVLGTLFYRFISENFTRYIEADDDSIDYAGLADSAIADDIKEDAVKTKGYFIYPSELFATVAKSANTNERGLAAIVCFPGIFYRGGAEGKIRKYLVDNNYVETVIALAPNLFFGTTIAVCILVLSKHKPETTTQFIDASELFKKETNTNTLTDDHINKIMEVFASKENVPHFARSVAFEEIAANDYNLSVSSYVEAKDTREKIDINQLNAKLKTTVAKIDRLRAEIDAIVAEIEG